MEIRVREVPIKGGREARKRGSKKEGKRKREDKDMFSLREKECVIPRE